MTHDLAQIKLPFGVNGCFEGQLPRQRLFLNRPAPATIGDLAGTVQHALQSPLGMPSLAQSLVAGDRVVIVVDRGTPQAATLVAELWKVLSRAGVEAKDIVMLEPAAVRAPRLPDPRELLPAEVAAQIPWILHDPTEEGLCAYLANTSSGERVYLRNQVIDSDFVLLVGPILQDPLLGFRGTASALYPGLSDTAAMRRSVGQGHEELDANDVRPLRQLIDEVSWLAGTQFCLGVVPGATTGIHAVFAGAPDPVLRAGQESAERTWAIHSDDKVELVIAAVEADATGHNWDQIGQAADAARHLVERGGRIVILSQVSEEPGPGVKLLRAHRSAKAALKPLRTAMPPDVITAGRIARAAAWARVYLLSAQPETLVEELFLYPISESVEVQRLLESDCSTAVIASAQHICVQR